MLREVPCLYQNHCDHGSHRKSARTSGYDHTQPIIIDDSDNNVERSLELSSRARSRRSQARKCMSLPQSDRVEPTTHGNTRQGRDPTGLRRNFEDGLKLRSSPNVIHLDVGYPDLLLEVRQAERQILSPRTNADAEHLGNIRNQTALQERLERRLDKRLQREEKNACRTAKMPHAHRRVTISQQTMPNPSKREIQLQRSKVQLVSAQQGTREEPIELEADFRSNLDDMGRKGIVEKVTIAEQTAKVAGHVSRKACECLVCGDSFPVTELPSLAGCSHPPQVCAICYAKWVAVQLEESSWREAKCPESKCNVRLTYFEIKHITTHDVFEQYDNFIARAALNEDRKSQSFVELNT